MLKSWKTALTKSKKILKNRQTWCWNRTYFSNPNIRSIGKKLDHFKVKSQRGVGAKGSDPSKRHHLSVWNHMWDNFWPMIQKNILPVFLDFHRALLNKHLETMLISLWDFLYVESVMFNGFFGKKILFYFKIYNLKSYSNFGVKLYPPGCFSKIAHMRSSHLEDPKVLYARSARSNFADSKLFYTNLLSERSTI